MSTRQRIRRAVESFKSAANDIGPITPGMSTFLLTRGQFSMIDIVHHCLAQIGPAHVSIWTWAIATYEIQCMEALMTNARITGALLVLDASADRRTPALIEAWRKRFGDSSVKICKNHAKVATLTNDRFRLCVRGSCNLNQNPRFENVDISEGDGAYDLVHSVEASLPVLKRKYSNKDAEAATGVSKAWEQSTLDMFRGKALKHWSPNK